MSFLKLRLRPQIAEQLRGRIDFSRITPDQCKSLSLQEINSIPIETGSHKLSVGELFQVDEGDHDKLVIEGDLRCMDRVGASMRSGSMVIEGSVGNAVGIHLRDGHLVIAGDAGTHTATGQRGGLIEVRGNVGDFAGGALPGDQRGMRGGTLHIHGNASRFLGFRMRRGTIVVRGDVDQACGASLIAGTIVVCGSIHGDIGNDMRRGTILSLATEPDLHLAPGFTTPEATQLSYLYLLLDAIKNECLTDLKPAEWMRKLNWRSIGDRAIGGLGEVIWSQA